MTAYIITFIASFCILVIEIVAGRILAPFVGVSLYTWTSIIGVVLAGISIGAFFGGKLADRYPETRTLIWLLFVAGIATLLISPVTNTVAAYRFPTSLMVRILLVTTITFFIPSCILGMISPVVVRLTIRNLENVGHIVGKIYAVSTLGSIIGTFAAGFFLISWMGTRHIILTMGGILVLTAVIWRALSGTKKAFGMILFPSLLVAVTYTAAFQPRVDADTSYYNESDYYTIKVKKAMSSDGKTPLKLLILDNLVHSYVRPDDPLHIEYKYEKIYSEVLNWKLHKNDSFQSLTIGGGGYTFPRYMEAFYPNARIDVVEIDPQVTQTAYDHLGLHRATRIRSYNTDGRWFVMNCGERYDIVFIDAYNDLSIPYHLTTREFARMVGNILKPDGIVLTNIIDDFQKGAFLPSYIRTLREAFGDSNVHVIAISPQFDKIHTSTFIVLAGKGSLNIKDFESFLKSRYEGKAFSAVVPEQTLNAFVGKTYSVVLRDDYAPVDNLIAPVFEARFGFNRKQR
jgi:spermidine synthase